MLTGAKDMLVLPELNALVGMWPEELIVEADTRDMPGVWVSADHQVDRPAGFTWFCHQPAVPERHQAFVRVQR